MSQVSLCPLTYTHGATTPWYQTTADGVAGAAEEAIFNLRCCEAMAGLQNGHGLIEFAVVMNVEFVDDGSHRLPLILAMFLGIGSLID